MKEAPIKIPIDGKTLFSAHPWREWFSDLFLAFKSVRLPSQTAAPVPARDESVIWMDFATGDIKITLNSGGTIKTATMVDFSAL